MASSASMCHECSELIIMEAMLNSGAFLVIGGGVASFVASAPVAAAIGIGAGLIGKIVYENGETIEKAAISLSQHVNLITHAIWAPAAKPITIGLDDYEIVD